MYTYAYSHAQKCYLENIRNIIFALDIYLDVNFLTQHYTHPVDINISIMQLTKKAKRQLILWKLICVEPTKLIEIEPQSDSLDSVWL